MVPIEQSGIDLLFGRLETTTSHVRVSNGLNLEKSKLVAKLVKCIVYLIKLIEQLLWRVILEKNLKLVNFNKNDRNFAFFLRNILLTLSNLVTNQRGNENVQNRFEL